jgi:thiol-disulfide isomerase/thioredoxin
MKYIIAIIILIILYNIIKFGLLYLYFRNRIRKEISGDLVLVYVDWCGHCKRFMPEYDNIKNELKTVNIRKINYDLLNDNEKSFYDKNGLDSFPTVYFIKNNKYHKYHKYNGINRKREIINWIHRL